MNTADRSTSRPLLLLVAGAKGAVASTLAAAIAAMKKKPDTILPSLTTGNIFSALEPIEATAMAGWDPVAEPMTACIKAQGVVPEQLWKPDSDDLDRIPVLAPPPASQDIKDQVEHLRKNIQDFKDKQPDAQPVFINLLPASMQTNLTQYQQISDLFEKGVNKNLPDLAYTLAAIRSEVPVINFTPNVVEIPAIIKEAVNHNVPIAGRDGKTGQTYFKVVLASALKARNFLVDGWYSLNILGNADGMNLMNPENAKEKLANKTKLLDQVLGYEVGKNYDAPSHKVHIDYYPPRGDAKEAWDVIDFSGMFGLPMSLRVNLQGRDSILAAPLALDLGRWMAALNLAGRSGLIAELGFYFKKPVGSNPPLTFQDQIQSLKRLEQFCDTRISTRS
jgi:myo-inositol-1-phosphate synthase